MEIKDIKLFDDIRLVNVNNKWYIGKYVRDVRDILHFKLLEGNCLTNLFGHYLSTNLAQEVFNIVDNLKRKMKKENWLTWSYVYKNNKYVIVEYLEEYACDYDYRLEIYKAQETTDIEGTKFLYWVESHYFSNEDVAEWLAYMLGY